MDSAGQFQDNADRQHGIFSLGWTAGKQDAIKVNHKEVEMQRWMLAVLTVLALAGAAWAGDVSTPTSAAFESKPMPWTFTLDRRMTWAEQTVMDTFTLKTPTASRPDTGFQYTNVVWRGDESNLLRFEATGTKPRFTALIYAGYAVKQAGKLTTADSASINQFVLIDSLNVTAAGTYLKTVKDTLPEYPHMRLLLRSDSAMGDTKIVVRARRKW